jgi:hypothetical protein
VSRFYEVTGQAFMNNQIHLGGSASMPDSKDTKGLSVAFVVRVRSSPLPSFFGNWRAKFLKFFQMSEKNRLLDRDLTFLRQTAVTG